jgi:hypothetical protein
MTGRYVSRRRNRAAALGLSTLAALVFAVMGLARAGAAVGPDVTVFNFTDVANYTASGGFCAYAVGTTSCNRGDVPLSWCNSGSGCAPGDTNIDHPVIAQNLYRLEDGRFEQVGMSWLKHGFASLNIGAAGCTGAGGGGCQPPPAGGRQLGIGCTDPYGGGLNGSQPLGPRSEVNGTTAVFPYPPSPPSPPYQTYDQRIKVPTTDMDPSLNPGALYWIEGQYLASDDAAAGNALNNASHQQVTVGAPPSFPLTMVGSFVEMQSAIFAWRAQDPTVLMARADLGGAILARFDVARKVTDQGGGIWHYEYTVRNHNVDRSARGFNVRFPVATTFTNVGFKDIEHHSGEPYATTDWSVSTTADQVSWFTDTFAVSANANALRFATMFNFWFDADQPPYADSGALVHTIDLFKPGEPQSIESSGFHDLFAEGFEGGNANAWSGHT